MKNNIQRAQNSLRQQPFNARQLVTRAAPRMSKIYRTRIFRTQCTRSAFDATISWLSARSSCSQCARAYPENGRDRGENKYRSWQSLDPGLINATLHIFSSFFFFWLHGTRLRVPARLSASIDSRISSRETSPRPHSPDRPFCVSHAFQRSILLFLLFLLLNNDCLLSLSLFRIFVRSKERKKTKGAEMRECSWKIVSDFFLSSFFNFLQIPISRQCSAFRLSGRLFILSEKKYWTCLSRSLRQLTIASAPVSS